MTDEERGILRDMQGFIQFAINKDMKFMDIAAVLNQDAGAVLRKALGGTPLRNTRTAGFAKHLPEGVAIDG